MHVQMFSSYFDKSFTDVCADEEKGILQDTCFIIEEIITNINIDKEK